MLDELQGTDEWRQDRAGKITASRFADAIAMTEEKVAQKADAKTGRQKGDIIPARPLACRTKYMYQLAFERVSGSPVHEISARSLQYGKDSEAFARNMYELITGAFVDLAGFVIHADHSFIGCSVDGLVNDDGMTEIKCPHDESVHVQTLIEGVPEDHIPQIQGCLFVTGRQWCDFISFDPRQAPHLQIYIQRIHRDDIYIQKLKSGLLDFEKELQAVVNKLEAKAIAA